MEKYKKYVLFLVLFIVVASISELIFTFNTKRFIIEQTFFKLIKKNNNIETVLVQNYGNKFAHVYYDYLANIVTAPTLPGCKPVCVEYEDALWLETIFDKLDSKGNLTELNTIQKSNLYYWMATVAVRTNHDKALSFLKTSLEFADNPLSKNFYDDLNKLELILSNSDSQKYFNEKLTNLDKIQNQYQKDYFSKASYKLALLNESPDKKLEYLEKAILLNQWNEEYYLELAAQYKQNQFSFNQTLNKCITNLREDSLNCQKLLESK